MMNTRKTSTLARATLCAFALCTASGALAQTAAPKAQPSVDTKAQPSVDTKAQPSVDSKAQPAAEAKAAGVPFASKEARFTVSFPAQPKASQREDKTAEGRTVVTHFQSVEDGPRYYAMSWVQMPASPGDAKARERIMESAAGGALKSVQGGVLVSKAKASVGKTAGLDYVIDAPKDAQRLRQRVFLVGDKLVQQTYTGPAGSETEAGVKQFMGSLKFTK